MEAAGEEGRGGGQVAQGCSHHPRASGRGTDWPGSFFRHRQRSRAPATLTQAQERVKAAEKVLAAAQKVYDDFVQAQAEADAAAQEEAAAQQAFELALKESEEANAKKKAAEDALEQAKKKNK